MRQPVSTAQSHAVMSRLATSVDWEKIDGEAVQSLIKSPKYAGELFTEFLQTFRYCTPYLRPASMNKTYVPETSGDRLIFEHAHLFKLGMDPHFKNFPFKHKTESTRSSAVQPFTLVKSGLAREIFQSYSFQRISFTQEQILAMAEPGHSFEEKGRNLLMRDTKHVFACMLGGERYVVCLTVGRTCEMAIHTHKFEFAGFPYFEGTRIILPADIPEY